MPTFGLVCSDKNTQFSVSNQDLPDFVVLVGLGLIQLLNLINTFSNNSVKAAYLKYAVEDGVKQ